MKGLDLRLEVADRTPGQEPAPRYENPTAKAVWICKKPQNFRVTSRHHEALADTMRSSSLLLLLLLIAVCANGSRTFLPRLPVLETSTPGTANCTLKWHAQYIDHFSQSQGSKKYQQRYFVYDTAWKKDGPIFFYVGNESPVDLYVNATGLMWENAEEFGALLVFAEHRYWGLSQPLNGTDKSYLTPEQAMEDYATLVYDLKDELNAQSSPVIAFGGSYGGDLAAWSRMKYPATFEGAIAASAPVLGFLGEYPAWNSNLYFQVITRYCTGTGTVLIRVMSALYSH
jgi:lysosomal Pro-X carboxypeptidase